MNDVSEPEPTHGWIHPTGKVPQRVALLGCGPSIRSWYVGQFTYDRQFPNFHPENGGEIWSLNKGLRTNAAHLGFVLDDLVGEARRSPEYTADLNRLTIPIVTSIIDADVRRHFPQLDLYEYPFSRIMANIGLRRLLVKGADPADLEPRAEATRAKVRTEAEANAYYLHNSIPMILAYALFIGVRDVMLFGIDYDYPDRGQAEEGRANCEYWIGLLRGYGLNVYVTDDTTILNTLKQPWVYGYGKRPPTWPAQWGDEIAGELQRLTRRVIKT